MKTSNWTWKDPADYRGESDVDALNDKLSCELLEQGRRRRRIELILDASKLEQSAFNEVWDEVRQ